MKIIGITLDEVLRDFLGQLVYTYQKYHDNNIDLNTHSFTHNNLFEFFKKFKTEDEFRNFIYSEASLEIFGHADQMEDKIMSLFNKFIMDIEDEEEHKILIINREIGNAIPSTLFFLSKLSCKSNNIKFVNSYEDLWKEVDYLITATPELIKIKPENKICIKIKSPYNTDLETDYQFNSIVELMNNENNITEIFFNN